VDVINEVTEHLRGHGTLGRGDRRFDHGETEGLHPVARERDVAEFDRSEGAREVDAIGGVWPDPLKEQFLRPAEVILAAPERVVGVEADDEGRTHRWIALR
jgi:hypothetical protein